MPSQKKTPVTTQDRVAAVFDGFREGLHDAASDPGKKKVHHLRTNTRRLETIVQKLLPPNSEKQLTRQLKKIRRAAGEIRDLDVLSKLAEDFDSEDPNSVRSRAFVRAQLDLDRAKREKDFLQMLDPQRLKHIDALLNRCERSVDASVNATWRQKDPLTAALAEYTQLARQFEPLQESNLHEFRKACKQLRYLAELSTDGSRKDRALEQFKRIQDAIGEWHDDIVLAESARNALSHPKRSKFLRELQQLRDAKLMEAMNTATDAKHELLRLQLQLTAEPKPARGTRQSRQQRAAS